MIFPAALTDGSEDLDLGAIAFLAKRAQRAYAEEAEIRDALKLKGGRLVKFWNVGTVECFLAVFNEAGATVEMTRGRLEWEAKGGKPFAVLAFRGTEPKKEPKDLLVDLAAWRVRPEGQSNGVAFHAGFYANMKPVWETLDDAFAELPDMPLYLSGHSKGAAEAILAAYHYPDLFTALVTIGAPRVGNAEFALRFQADGPPHYRVVNASDAVPLVPPWHWGFHHDGEPLYIDRKGTVHRRSSVWWRLWDRMQDLAAAGVIFHGARLRWRRPLERHDAGAYCDALDKVWWRVR